MARIGLLVPSSNTSVETEFYRLLPSEVTVHTARLLLRRSALRLVGFSGSIKGYGRLLREIAR